jgi:bla regulator protein blaR1
MNPITLAIDSPLMHALGWTLIHFLWQGACVGAVYTALRYTLRSRSPTARYQLAMFALVVMAIMPIATLLHLMTVVPENTQAQALAPFSVSAVILHPQVTQATGVGMTLLETIRVLMQRLVPWAVPLWILGVMVMSVRVWRGWQQTRFLRRTAIFSPLPAWKTSVDRLQAILGIHKAVRLAVSAGITVPSVIGWLKPIILIPPSVLTGLTPLQMELILAHELAHIRRQDYLWNLLQIFVDTLLFYHPVVRWISHHARMEREQCCDDIVVNLNGDAINYARALTELERLRTPRSAMVLGADGGQVIHRIHRLIGMPAADMSPFSWALPLFALSLLITGSLARIPFQNPAFQEHAASNTGYVESDAASAHNSVVEKAVQATHVAISDPRMASLQPVQSSIRFNPVTLTSLSLKPENEPLAEVTSSKPVMRHSGGAILERHNPQYPQYALERGTEGSATVSFILNASGTVTDVHVTHIQGSRLFGQAAVDAIKQWKFSPVMIDGQPVEQAMTQEFDFHLDNPAASVGTCRIPIGFHICTRG